MIFIGVDPGKSGAMVCLDSTGRVVGHVKNVETERDLWAWLSGATSFGECFAVIEQVHSMPKQGVASSFKFGVSYGLLWAFLIAAGARFEHVTPVRWQTVMRCRTKGDKNVSKARAQELFPREHITHATADAFLLAEYARVTRLGLYLPTATPSTRREPEHSSPARDSTSPCPGGECPTTPTPGQSP